jgi:hypothetical protein
VQDSIIDEQLRILLDLEWETTVSHRDATFWVQSAIPIIQDKETFTDSLFPVPFCMLVMFILPSSMCHQRNLQMPTTGGDSTAPGT